MCVWTEKSEKGSCLCVATNHWTKDVGHCVFSTTDILHFFKEVKQPPNTGYVKWIFPLYGQWWSIMTKVKQVTAVRINYNITRNSALHLRFYRVFYFWVSGTATQVNPRQETEISMCICPAWKWPLTTIHHILVPAGRPQLPRPQGQAQQLPRRWPVNQRGGPVERVEELRRYGPAIRFTSTTAQVLLSLSWACTYMKVSGLCRKTKKTCGVSEADKLVQSLCGQGFQINLTEWLFSGSECVSWSACWAAATTDVACRHLHERVAKESSLLWAGLSVIQSSVTQCCFQ